MEWARRGAALGAGEIVLNSIDADGTKQGYDNELNRRVADAVDVPVVASGGAGTLEHLRDGFVVGGVDAVLVASMLHFNATSIARIKQLFARRGRAGGVAGGRRVTACGPVSGGVDAWNCRN